MTSVVVITPNHAFCEVYIWQQVYMIECGVYFKAFVNTD